VAAGEQSISARKEAAKHTGNNKKHPPQKPLKVKTLTGYLNATYNGLM